MRLSSIFPLPKNSSSNREGSHLFSSPLCVYYPSQHLTNRSWRKGRPEPTWVWLGFWLGSWWSSCQWGSQEQTQDLPSKALQTRTLVGPTDVVIQGILLSRDFAWCPAQNWTRISFWLDSFLPFPLLDILWWASLLTEDNSVTLPCGLSLSPCCEVLQVDTLQLISLSTP